MKGIIEKFVIDNKLDLTTDGSALNSTCCIISGYALHIGITEINILINIFVDYTSNDFDEELTRVFLFAKKNNYGKWWESEEAIKQYIF